MGRKPGECGIHIRQEKSISGREWSTVHAAEKWDEDWKVSDLVIRRPLVTLRRVVGQSENVWEWVGRYKWSPVV